MNFLRLSASLLMISTLAILVSPAAQSIDRQSDLGLETHAFDRANCRARKHQGYRNLKTQKPNQKLTEKSGHRSAGKPDKSSSNDRAGEATNTLELKCPNRGISF
jgi:hypothetical protein